MAAASVLFPKPTNLRLDVKPVKPPYRPGEAATVNLDVRSSEGEPAQSALGLLVYDQALEELAGTEASLFTRGTKASIRALASVLSRRITDAIQIAEAGLNTHRPNGAFHSGSIWHAVLFYTAGELVAEQIPGYVPYADKNGLWVRAWPNPDRAFIEQDWKPHLNGSLGLQQALSKLADDLASASSHQ